MGFMNSGFVLLSLVFAWFGVASPGRAQSPAEDAAHPATPPAELEECRAGLALAWAEMEKLESVLEEARAAVNALTAENQELAKQLRQRDDLLLRLRAALVAMKARETGKGAEEEAGPPRAAARETVAAPDAQALSVFELVAEGHRALKESRVADAEVYFNRALKQKPDLISGRLGLAAAYYARSDFEKAKALINEVLREDRNQPQALGLSGIMAWQEGDFRHAQTRLERAIRLDPRDALLQNYLGIVMHGLNRYPEAIQALRKAVELDPEHAEARFNLAVLLATDKVPKLAEAKTVYEEAIRLGSERDEKLEKLIYR